MVCRIHELLCASISVHHCPNHVGIEQAGALRSSGRSSALLGSQSADRSLGRDASHGTKRGSAQHRAHRALRRGTASTHAAPGSKLPLWVAEFSERHGPGPVARGGGRIPKRSCWGCEEVFCSLRCCISDSHRRKDSKIIGVLCSCVRSTVQGRTHEAARRM